MNSKPNGSDFHMVQKTISKVLVDIYINIYIYLYRDLEFSDCLCNKLNNIKV